MSGKKGHGKAASGKKTGRAATPALQVCADAGVDHEVREFDHHTTNYGEEAAEMLASEGIEADQIFKTLLIDLAAGTEPKPDLAVAVVPVTGRLSLKHAAVALKERGYGHGKASMAKPKDAERSSGYITGGISPLGQKHRLPTVIDETALLCDTMYVSGGKRGLDIGLSPQDLISLTDATTADILEGH